MKRFMLSLLYVLSSLAPYVEAYAQAPGDTAAMQKRIDEATRKADAAVLEAVRSKQQRTINLDAIPAPQKSGASALNIESLAAQYRESVTAPVLDPKPQLVVFVSMNMPRASLEKLLDDAPRYGATLVMRGLIDGSITTTAGKVQQLIGTRRVAWTVDPDAFKRYRVNRVPSYVLVRAQNEVKDCGDSQCLASGEFVQLTGDVPIRYALEQFSRTPGFERDVEQLGGRP
jgi:conjugal transfer pilus assembly protein TrbC